MKEKKLEWAKPVLRDLGAVLTDGKVITSTCSDGAADTANCVDGGAVAVFCYAGGTYV